MIYSDKHLNINLANDNKCTLYNYTWLDINVRDVKAMIQVYIILITAYDLLLELKWQQQVRMNIDFSEREVSIQSINRKSVMVNYWVVSIEVLKQILIVQIEEKDNDDNENNLIKSILNEPEKGQRWAETQSSISANLTLLRIRQANQYHISVRHLNWQSLS